VETKKLIIIILLILVFIFVVLPILIVVGLVGLGLGLQVMGTGPVSMSDTSSKMMWKSAEPIAITDWARSGDNLTVVLKNNSSETLSINSVQIQNNLNVNLTGIPPGGTSTVIISGLGNCKVGSKYSFVKSMINIIYSENTASVKTQSGAADIVGTC